MKTPLTLLIIDSLEILPELIKKLGEDFCMTAQTGPAKCSSDADDMINFARQQRGLMAANDEQAAHVLLIDEESMREVLTSGLPVLEIGRVAKCVNLLNEYDRGVIFSSSGIFHLVKERGNQPPQISWERHDNHTKSTSILDALKGSRSTHPVIKLLFVDTVARLDEHAERLKLGKCVEWTTFADRNAVEGESAMEAAARRNKNSRMMYQEVTEDTTFYIVVPPELLTASIFDRVAAMVVMREKHIDTSMMFLPAYQAIISEEYFQCVRHKYGHSEEGNKLPALEDQVALRRRAMDYCKENNIELVPLRRGISRGILAHSEFRSDWLTKQLSPEGELSYQHLKAQLHGTFETEPGAVVNAYAISPDPFGILRDKQQPSDCLTEAQKQNALTLIIQYMQKISAVDAFKLGTEITTEAGSDEHTFTVSVTTRDPLLVARLRDAGLVSEEVKPNPLGRGLTDEAARKLFREQNPHLFAETGSYLSTPKCDPVGNIHNLGDKSNAED